MFTPIDHREWNLSMIKLHFYQWWRLLHSPTNNDESLMLELSEVWEPLNKVLGNM